MRSQSPSVLPPPRAWPWAARRPCPEPAGGPPSGSSAATSFLDSSKPPRATTGHHLQVPPAPGTSPASPALPTAPRKALEGCFLLVGGSLPGLPAAIRPLLPTAGSTASQLSRRHIHLRRLHLAGNAGQPSWLAQDAEPDRSQNPLRWGVSRALLTVYSDDASTYTDSKNSLCCGQNKMTNSVS